MNFSPDREREEKRHKEEKKAKEAKKQREEKVRKNNIRIRTFLCFYVPTLNQCTSAITEVSNRRGGGGSEIIFFQYPCPTFYKHYTKYIGLKNLNNFKGIEKPKCNFNKNTPFFLF